MGHVYLPTETLDELDIQADDSTNSIIDQILANIKVFRAQVNKSLDTLETTVERMRSVSLKGILDPFFQKSSEPATIIALQAAIAQNVILDEQGEIKMKKRPISEICERVENELVKVRKVFLDGIQKIVPKPEQKFVKKIRTVEEAQQAIEEIKNLINIVEMELDFSESSLSELEVVMVLKPLLKFKNIQKFKLNLW